MDENVNVDVAEECDYNCLKNKIKTVLRRYFEADDNGEPNKEFDANYTAQDAIDDIHDIVGDI